MKKISFVMRQMEEELEDACTYIDWAEKYKTEDRMAAEVFCKISEQELGHYNMLKDYLMKELEKMKTTEPEKAHTAMIIFEWECEKYTKEEIKIKAKHAAFMK